VTLDEVAALVARQDVTRRREAWRAVEGADAEAVDRDDVRAAFADAARRC